MRLSACTCDCGAWEGFLSAGYDGDLSCLPALLLSVKGDIGEPTLLFAGSA